MCNDCCVKIKNQQNSDKSLEKYTLRPNPLVSNLRCAKVGAERALQVSAHGPRVYDLLERRNSDAFLVQWLTLE